MTKFWMVYVEGRTWPTKHETSDSAFAEATRLAGLQENIGRNVYVLEAYKHFKGEVTIKGDLIW